jgi:protocatechuate 3,4-dioxygenase alpha subunit
LSDDFEAQYREECLKDHKDLIPTPSQTVGPYFHLGLTQTRSVGKVAGEGVKGERVNLICRVFDGDGLPLPDAMIELWQADADGKYNHPEDMWEQSPAITFRGFGRMPTTADGSCVFETIKPGQVAGLNGKPQAPHINISIFARGLLKHLPTRIYFEGDPANVTDAVLALVPEERRGTLMAQLDPATPGTWRFDIHLCGDHETVFFDV